MAETISREERATLALEKIATYLEENTRILTESLAIAKEEMIFRKEQLANASALQTFAEQMLGLGRPAASAPPAPGAPPLSIAESSDVPRLPRRRPRHTQPESQP